MHKFTVVLLIAISHMPLNAQQEVSDYVLSRIVGKETPGFQYIVASADSIIFELNAGFARISEKDPVTSSTEFRAFSATKTFTAHAILQLVREQKLSLDTDVAALLDLPFEQPVPVKYLLNHTAGVTGTPLITEIHSGMEEPVFDYPAAARKILKEHAGLRRDSGKKFRYSNYGYLMLEMLVEQVSGMSYEDYVQKKILEPLRNKSTFAFTYSENTARGYQKRSTLFHMIYSMIKKVRSLYDRKEEKFQGYQDIYLNAKGYGGLITNARGLAAYGQALLLGGELVPDESFRHLVFEEQLLSNGKSSGHSYAWFVKSYKGITYYSHPGGGGGYSCEIRIYPDQQIVTVFMMNITQTPSHLKLLNKLDRFYLDSL